MLRSYYLKIIIFIGYMQQKLDVICNGLKIINTISVMLINLGEKHVTSPETNKV